MASNTSDEQFENFKFVDGRDVVNKYACLNCTKISKSLVVANCEHIFCLHCLPKIFGKKCSGCGNVQITEVRKHDQYERELLNLKLECPNKQHGCQEIISFRNYQKHLATECQFSTSAVLQKDHQTYEPLQTSTEDNVQKIKVTIKEMNAKFDVITNDIEILKNQLTMQADAQQNFVQEIYKKLSDVEKMNFDFHINQNFKSKSESNREEEEESNQVESHDDLGERDEQAFNFLWRIQNFNKCMEQPHCEVASQNFYSKEIGPSFSVELHKIQQKKYLRIFLNWKVYHNANYPIKHARKFTLLDQSEESKKKHVILWDMSPANSSKGINLKEFFFCEKLVPISLLQQPSAYVRNDSVLLKVSLFPLTVMYKSVASKCGTLLWPVENYSTKKHERVSGRRKFLHSPSFYTASEGYRVQAMLYLDGRGKSKGKCISVCVAFVAGEHDSSLPFPFNAMIKILLLDQTESDIKRHVKAEIVVPYHEWDAPHEKNDFVLQKTAEEATYLKNDTLLFKIKVKII